MRSTRRLISTRYVEEALRQVAAGEKTLLPGQVALARTGAEVAAKQRELDTARGRQAEFQTTRQLAFDHALELWHNAVRHDPPNLADLAVLFSLAGLETVPAPMILRLPKSAWIRQIVGNLLEDHLHRSPILRWADSHMEELCRTFGTQDGVKLRAGNIGRIVFRFRESVFREV